MNRLVLFLILLTGGSTFGQILRVDKNHLESDSAGYFNFTGETSFSLDNRSISLTERLVYTRLSSKADLLYVSKHHAYIFINSIEYFSSTNTPTFSTGYAHARVNFRRQHTISYEMFAQVQFDQVRRMRLRTLGGGGLRFTAIDENGFDVHIGSGIMYELERWRKEDTNPDTEFYKGIPKSSNYIGIDFTLSQHVRLNLWGQYQVGHDREENITRNRYATEVTLNFIITKHLSWNNRFSYYYDAQPVIAINPAFFQIMNGLKITF